MEREPDYLQEEELREPETSRYVKSVDESSHYPTDKQLAVVSFVAIVVFLSLAALCWFLFGLIVCGGGC